MHFFIFSTNTLAMSQQPGCQAYTPDKSPQLELELKVLGKIIYKSRNQHKSALYYQKLSLLYRSLLRFCSDQKTEQTKEKIENLCIACYSLFRCLIGQTFFLPLAVTCAALVSRIFYIVKRRKITAPIARCSLEEIDFFGSGKLPLPCHTAEEPPDIDAIFGDLA